MDGVYELLTKGKRIMQLLKCKAGHLLAEIDGGYWIVTPRTKLFYGCDREKAVAAWRWYVKQEIKKGE